MSSQDAPEESALSMEGNSMYYMKSMRRFLTYVDAWPYHELGAKRPSKFIRSKQMCVLSWLLILASATSYMIKNNDALEFDDQMQSFMGVFLICLAVKRGIMICLVSFGTTAAKFVREIHLVYFKDKDEYSTEIYNKVEKILKYFADIGLLFLIVPTTVFNVAGVIFNLKQGLYSSEANGTLLQAMYLDLPFDYTSSFNVGYMAAFIVVFTVVLDVGVIMVYTDLMLISIFFHLWGHLKILRHTLETCPKPIAQNCRSLVTCPWFTDEENESITTRLKECIEYHRFIRTSLADVSGVYGSSLCFYHFFYIVCGCVVLVECTILDASKIIQSTPILLCLNVLLIQESFLFEFLRTESEMVKYDTYELPWESMNIKNRKLVLFYLMNLQEPMIPNALGLLEVGVKMMATLMKTTVSYYMFLRTLNE